MIDYQAEARRSTTSPADCEHSADEPPRRAVAGPSLTILVVPYFVAAVVATYPIIWQLGKALPGRFSDQPFYVWAIDTFWMQVRAGTTPFWTNRVLYPVGANLMHATIAPFVSVFAYPFGSPILYLSIAVLASLVGAAMGMAYLVRLLTQSMAAAAVAGLCYAFSPAVLSVIKASHYYTAVAAALMPWGLAALVTFLSTGRMGPLIALSMTTWALVFTDYYVTVMFLIVVVVVGVPSLVAQPARFPRVLVAGIANVALALLIVQALPSLNTSDLPPGGLGFTSMSNTNIADFFVPNLDNPLLGAKFGRWAYDHYNNDVDSYFLGWGILALAVAGIAANRRGIVPWLGVAALMCGVLACGTAIRWGSHELLVESRTPWHWFAQLPSFRAFDSPRRFAIGVQLVLATLVGVGLATIAQRTGRSLLALFAGILLFAVEYGQVGMPLVTMDVPNVYRLLANQPGDRTLLELPSGITESKGGFGLDMKGGVQNGPQMYWQTIHRKQRVGGYLSRIPISTYRWFENEPIIGDLFTLTSTDGSWGPRHLDTLPDYPPDVVQKFSEVFRLGWVVLGPNPRQPRFAADVERLLGARIVHRENVEGYVLYTLAE
jgi:hypothetical protein